MSKWSSMLFSLETTKEEQKLFKKFLKNPQGRLFLQVANILSSKGYSEEAIELLVEGCQRYPNHHSAAVQLAQYYFDRGLFTHSRNTLARHQIILDRNVKGATLWFYLSVLFDDFATSVQVLEGFFQAAVLDQEALKIGETLRRKGPYGAREDLVELLARKGVDLDPKAILEATSAKPSTEDESQKRRSKYFGFEKISVEPLKENQFFVLPIGEILFPGGNSDDNLSDERLGSSSSYLDSQTMAEIYENQGQAQQAMQIYQRLLLKSPQNDMYRHKIAKLQDAVLMEKSILPEVQDDSLGQAMQSRELIDHQISKVSELIQLLEEDVRLSSLEGSTTKA